MEYRDTDFKIKELGSFYFKDKTFFRVFAPESKDVHLIIHEHGYAMHRNGLVFEIGLAGDLEGIPYYYVNDAGKKYRDPFAYYSDEEFSYVLDTNKFIKEVYYPGNCEDIVLYETSVRDFSSDESFCGKYKKKFLSFCEKGLKLHDYYMIGLDYLVNIGITHLQLMPTLEFDNDHADYNWGYNPVLYNIVEKDYVVNQADPYAYINELRQMVNTLHQNGIRVCLDLVFNHVYNRDNFDLNKMLMGHTFRYKEDGSYAEGSYCGNEIKSEDPFVSAYIVEMVERYLFLFDIDGVRLDLMGIMDKNTVLKIEANLKKYKKDFIVYGEGWNMGEVLPLSQKACMENAKELTSIAFFNDNFRDNIVKYVCGDNSINERIKEVLSGNNKGLHYRQSINYVECHDNATFFDHLVKYMPEDKLEGMIERCKLAIALCLLARGIPFLHSGQEFLRTKHLVDNSYNSGDSINKIDWNRRVEYNSIADYTKDLIALRKRHGEFENENTSVSFDNYYECIVYRLDNLLIVINNNDYEYLYKDNETYTLLFNKDGACEKEVNLVSIPKHSLVILEKRI